MFCQLFWQLFVGLILKVVNNMVKSERRINVSRRGDCIHKRKDGRWEGRFNQGRTANGKIKYGSVYGRSYAEVKELLSKKDDTKKANHFSNSAFITFGEVVKLWMQHNSIRLKGGTINKYQNLIETHILPGLGVLPINKIDSTIINHFLNQTLISGRKNGVGELSSSYVRGITIIINAVIKYAAREELIQPLKNNICKPPSIKKEISTIDFETQEKLELHILENLDLTKAGIYIALHTGLRIGEICALSWEDIDFDKQIIRVRHTVARVRASNDTSQTQLIIDSPKTKASIREIPISSKLMPIMRMTRELSKSQFVISNSSNFVNPRTFEYRYHKVLKECEIESINFHAIRHTFATKCVAAGVDVKSLSEILGHGNVSITLNTYVHSSMEMKRKQLEKLNERPFSNSSIMVNKVVVV